MNTSLAHASHVLALAWWFVTWMALGDRAALAPTRAIAEFWIVLGLRLHDLMI